MSEPSHSTADEQDDDEELEDTEIEDNSPYVIETNTSGIKTILFLPFDVIWETTVLVLGVVCILLLVYDFAIDLKSNAKIPTPTALVGK